jgi:CRISPR-associated protein Cmr6
MVLPLFQGLHAPAHPDANCHMGLWFERYFSAYPDGFDTNDKEKYKDASNSWLKTCVRPNHGEQFNSRLFDKAVRTLDMALSFGGEARIFRCAGRFVTGTGNAHSLENGFTWHPTLGMPYLPGSAVKGLARAVIETALDDSDDERKRLLKLWFGTEAKGDVADQAGAVIFLDALPVAPCDLKAEVLTPHMGKWYEKGGKEPLNAETMPGDWHSPVPVTWLAANRVALQFTLLQRPGAEPVALSDVWEALAFGLSRLGAGAKTAIGFGLFAEDKPLQEQVSKQLNNQRQKKADLLAERQHQQTLANATPAQRHTLELQVFLESLPEKMPASDARSTELWGRLEGAIEAVFSTGSATEKAALHALISGARDKKFVVSSKKEKEFKAQLARLLT